MQPEPHTIGGCSADETYVTTLERAGRDEQRAKACDGLANPALFLGGDYYSDLAELLMRRERGAQGG